jgi:hypothetical protein
VGIYFAAWLGLRVPLRIVGHGRSEEAAELSRWRTLLR